MSEIGRSCVERSVALGAGRVLLSIFFAWIFSPRKGFLGVFSASVFYVYLTLRGSIPHEKHTRGEPCGGGQAAPHEPYKPASEASGHYPLVEVMASGQRAPTKPPPPRPTTTPTPPASGDRTKRAKRRGGGRGEGGANAPTLPTERECREGTPSGRQRRATAPTTRARATREGKPKRARRRHARATAGSEAERKRATGAEPEQGRAQARPQDGRRAQAIPHSRSEAEPVRARPQGAGNKRGGRGAPPRAGGSGRGTATDGRVRRPAHVGRKGGEHKNKYRGVRMGMREPRQPQAARAGARARAEDGRIVGRWCDVLCGSWSAKCRESRERTEGRQGRPPRAAEGGEPGRPRHPEGGEPSNGTELGGGREPLCIYFGGGREGTWRRTGGHMEADGRA